MPFIDFHAHNSEVEDNTVKVVNKFPDTFKISDSQYFTSVGLHPWKLKKDFNEQLILLNNIASNRNVIAIGEAGLDKAIEIDLELQKAIFLAQAEIAETLAKPMIIHSVKTYYDFIALRKYFSKSPPWIIHGFTGNIKTAKELIKHNFYLSFGKGLFNEKSNAPKAIVNVPITNIFLETDDSDLEIKDVYCKAAELLHVSIEKLSSQINNNFQRLFQIDLTNY